MRFFITLLSSILFLFILGSCEKEVNLQNSNGSGTGGGTGNTNAITGDYDFAGLAAHTQSVVTVNTGGSELKSITVSDYVTQSNTGTVTITANQFISTGVGYSIDTTMNVQTFQDNLLIDNSDFPFVQTVPASSTTSPYTRNSSDSITVTGAIGVAAGGSGSTPTGPVGLKLSWSGDTLLLRLNSGYTQTVTQGGVPGTVVAEVSGVMKLKKK